MKYLFLKVISLVLCIILSFGSALATDPNEHEIHFIWEYTAIADLVGFRIFQDGVLLVDVPDKAARTVTKKTILPNAKACFTMSAYGVTPEQESTRSSEYCIKRPLPTPTMSLPKYYRLYIQAGPVNTTLSK